MTRCMCFTHAGAALLAPSAEPATAFATRAKAAWSGYCATSAYRELPYDPVKDIQPIILIGTTGLLMTVFGSGNERQGAHRLRQG